MVDYYYSFANAHNDVVQYIIAYGLTRSFMASFRTQQLLHQMKMIKLALPSFG